MAGDLLRNCNQGQMCRVFGGKKSSEQTVPSFFRSKPRGMFAHEWHEPKMSQKNNNGNGSVDPIWNEVYEFLIENQDLRPDTRAELEELIKDNFKVSSCSPLLFWLDRTKHLLKVVNHSQIKWKNGKKPQNQSQQAEWGVSSEGPSHLFFFNCEAKVYICQKVALLFVVGCLM